MTDIDVLSSEFVQMRNEPNLMMTKFRFDNVPFVCNLIDAVGRRRAVPRNSQAQAKTQHAASESSTLPPRPARRRTIPTTKIQAEYDASVKKADDEKDKTFAEFKKIFDDLQKKQNRGEEVDPAKIQAAAMQLAMKQRTAERAAEVEKARLERARDQELAQIERTRDQQIQQIQNEYKWRATALPPLMPLLGRPGRLGSPAEFANAKACPSPACESNRRVGQVRVAIAGPP